MTLPLPLIDLQHDDAPALWNLHRYVGEFDTISDVEYALDRKFDVNTIALAAGVRADVSAAGDEVFVLYHEPVAALVPFSQRSWHYLYVTVGPPPNRVPGDRFRLAPVARLLDTMISFERITTLRFVAPDSTRRSGLAQPEFVIALEYRQRLLFGTAERAWRDLLLAYKRKTEGPWKWNTAGTGVTVTFYGNT